MLILGLSLIKILYGVKPIFEQGVTFTKILVIFINSSQRKPSKWVEVIRLELMLKRVWNFHYATPFWCGIYVRLCKLLTNAVFFAIMVKSFKILFTTFITTKKLNIASKLFFNMNSKNLEHVENIIFLF